MGLSLNEAEFDTLFDGISNFYNQMIQQEEIAATQEQEYHDQDQQDLMIAKAIMDYPFGILVGDFAKVLRNLDIRIGQNQLFKWLRQNKYLNKDNMPYQQYVNLGLFVLKETVVVTANSRFVKYTPKVTGKGQCYFAKKLLNERHGVDKK